MPSADHAAAAAAAAVTSGPTHTVPYHTCTKVLIMQVLIGILHSFLIGEPACHVPHKYETKQDARVNHNNRES